MEEDFLCPQPRSGTHCWELCSTGDTALGWYQSLSVAPYPCGGFTLCVLYCPLQLETTACPSGIYRHRLPKTTSWLLARQKNLINTGSGQRSSSPSPFSTALPSNRCGRKSRNKAWICIPSCNNFQLPAQGLPDADELSFHLIIFTGLLFCKFVQFSPKLM